MKNLETTIIINGTKEQVWNALLDFNQFSNWNPFITELKGNAVVGETLKVTINPPGQSPQQFTPVVKVVEPNKEFRWLGKLFVTGLFDGEHYFILEQVNEQQVKLIHGENFTGILVGLVMKMYGEATKKGFESMNEAIKTRVENTIIS